MRDDKSFNGEMQNKNILAGVRFGYVDRRDAGQYLIITSILSGAGSRD